MKRLTIAEVHAQKVTELGLDSGALDLASVEAIAGALRRAAGFVCPCSPTTLVRTVVNPLRGLVKDLESIKDLTEETLEAIVAHGDLLEHSEVLDGRTLGRGTFLYPAPPSFVLRESGMAIILGIAQDQLSALSEDFEVRIEYINHVRRIFPLCEENLRDVLTQRGLIELSNTEWLKAPPTDSAVRHRSKLDSLLDAASPSRDIPGLMLLDSDRPVNYYRGRWVEPRRQTGRFVGRRRQAYGSDLWCYVQLCNGLPERMIDLPVNSGRWRGCDEAWQLQLAIDASRGEPQRFKKRSLSRERSALEIFSPLPMWARRRWDAIGEPVMSSGCLLAYSFANTELDEELRFAREALWLGELRAGGQLK